MGVNLNLSKEMKAEVERFKERQQRQLLGFVEEQGRSIIDKTLTGPSFSMASPGTNV